MTAEDYLAQLRDIGYINVEIQDITQHVFAGLAKYIDGIAADSRKAAALDAKKLASYKGFAKILRWWAGGKLRFVLVKGMKGGIASKSKAASSDRA